MRTQVKTLRLLSFTLILMLFQGCVQKPFSHKDVRLSEEQPLENNGRESTLGEVNLPPNTTNYLEVLVEVKEDNEKLRNFLVENNQITRMEAWHGVLLLVKASPEDSIVYYHYNSEYSDSNNNKVQDEQDEGFFNPASTVKVGIAALILEKLNSLGLDRDVKYREVGAQRWHSISSDLEAALVVSSNEATNRLILFLGFDFIRESLQSKELKKLSINRLMLDQGTLISSPSFEINDNGTIIVQPYQEVTRKTECFETKERIGNCASAVDLVGVMARIIQPESFLEEANFVIREEDRFWLKELMSKTPREAGFEHEDNFCRFLQPLYEKEASKSGKMLSKCGIGLFSHSYIDTTYIQTDNGENYYIVFAVQPPRYISKEQATEWMSDVSELILRRF